VRRSPRWWAEEAAIRPRLLVVAAAAGAALGVVADASLYDWMDARAWVPDLVTGWTLIACGLVALWRRPEARVPGTLLTAAGFAWFAGNFETSEDDSVAWWSSHLRYVHLALLVQLVVTFPRGRATGRAEAVAIAAGYAVALVPGLRQHETVAILLALFLVAVAFRGYVGAVGVARRRRLFAAQATLLLATPITAVGVARLATADPAVWDATLVIYETAVCAVAVALLAGLLRTPWQRAAVTDLVVELGEKRSGTVRGELAWALGDPTLQVAYRLRERNGYVDGAGRPLALPKPESGLVVTRVERDGEEVAVVVHDPAVLDEPSLLEAVGLAARLGAANAELQAEVRSRVADVASSRRRLLAASDDERRDLEQRLDDGARRRLDAVADVLAAARAAGDPATGAAVARAEAQTARARDDIDALARGLHPRELTEHGLEGALRALVARTRLPVELDITAAPLPAAVEAAAFFVCSEALANVVKHASASRARVAVRGDAGRLEVEVEDDGVGGADAAAGTGLRGLVDRVEVLGGTLLLETPPRGGTRVVVELPVVTS
jgi:signal transduction histidine kinase